MSRSAITGLLVAAYLLAIGWPAVIAQATPPDGIRLTTSPLPIDLVTTPGKAVTTQLRVRNSGSHTETLKVGLLTFSAQGDSGKPILRDKQPGDDFFDWVTFSNQQFTAAPNEWKTITMTIAPPPSAAFGYYYAVTFGRASEQKSATQSATLAGAAATLVLLDVNVPGATRKLTIDSFATSHPWYEFLPVTMATTISNSGNVHSAPFGTIYISPAGHSQDVISQIDLNPAKGNILPNSLRLFTSSWDSGFPLYQQKIKNGHAEQQLVWDFSQANKLRFGKYTAHLVLAYDDGHGKDVPLEASADFWIIPWRLIGAGFVVGILVLIGVWSIGRSIWRIIRRNDASI